MKNKRVNTGKQIKELGSIASRENPSKNFAVNMGQTGVTGEERYQLIAKAAYLRAEQRGFSPGSELEDWLAAESDIDRMLAKSSADSAKGA
jgi:Protein of unknown function (DUF2934)